MRTAPFVSLMVIVCGCSAESQPAACELEPELAKRVTSATPVDCGELEASATSEQRIEARRCALDALAAQRAFKLVSWRSEPSGRASAEAYAYAGGDALVSLLQYDSASSAGQKAGANLGEQTCRSLQIESDCVQGAESLCLACTGLVEASLACHERTSESAACRGMGNYQAGKEGSYQPCCPGLLEVFQQTRAEVNGTPACVDLPLRVYACIEGRCGDGRCEAPEAVPCGCALDCGDMSSEP